MQQISPLPLNLNTHQKTITSSASFPKSTPCVCQHKHTFTPELWALAPAQAAMECPICKQEVPADMQSVRPVCAAKNIGEIQTHPAHIASALQLIGISFFGVFELPLPSPRNEKRPRPKSAIHAPHTHTKRRWVGGASDGGGASD
jgi:hypothetical protein